MDLLIDIGNTRIKWVLSDRGSLSSPGEFAHRELAIDDVTSLFGKSLGSVSQPDRIWVSNVGGGSLSAAVDRVAHDLWGVPPEFARSELALGPVRNAYHDYRQLGVDRWLALLATHQRHPGCACIIDAGTAVTIDLMHGNGQHVGGYILPGVDLMLRALQADTGNLARLSERSGVGQRVDEAAAGDFGRDTASAMIKGSTKAICSLIEECLTDLRRIDPGAAFLLTGGGAAHLAAQLSGPVTCCPQLVLEGLALYAANH